MGRVSGCTLALVMTMAWHHVGAEPADPPPTSDSVVLPPGAPPTDVHREIPDDPPAAPAAGPRSPAVPWVRGRFESIQVNVDGDDNNILGDAANEPSIAIDPTNPDRIVIGWRQFDTIASNFRQAGWAYSHDRGQSWTFPGVLEPGVFRSDPVLDVDAEGNFYYYSLHYDGSYSCQMFKSTDGGVTWQGPIPAFGGDKAWMAIDRTGGIGHGNIYAAWDYAGCCGDNVFTRSINGGSGYSYPIPIPEFPIWGTVSVGPDGAVYVGGALYSNFRIFAVVKSTTVQDGDTTPAFDSATRVSLGGRLRGTCCGGPNPGGLLGQVWVATDHSTGPTHGNVYLLASVIPFTGGNPLEVMFSRSIDGGETWSAPVRVSDDPPGSNAWQWFGTMSVAPNGRIDVVWNDTRNSGHERYSELFYSFSTDGGLSWSQNVPVSPVFDSHLGWPNQSKLGDYYDMIADDTGASVAYAATFNGEQDVYFLRISCDCNENGVWDETDIADGTSADCNGNAIPDECDLAGGTSRDCNDTDIPDECDIAEGTSRDRFPPAFGGDGIPDECQIHQPRPTASKRKRER